MPAGRPTKFKSEYVEQGYKLAREGFSIERIADFFSVSRDTIYEWGEKHSEFSDIIKKGKKEYALGIIVPSLIKSATGFHEYEEIEEIDPQPDPETGKAKMRVVRRIKRYYPPNATSGIYLTKNYAPDEFKDRTEMYHGGTVTVIAPPVKKPKDAGT